MDSCDNSLIEDYLLDLKEDTKIDQFNIKDRSMRLPGIKHKWVGRLIRHRLEVDKLLASRKSTVEKIAETLQRESPVVLPNDRAIKMASTHDKIAELDEQIRLQKIYVDFLERVEKICSGMSFDIRNAQEIMKLETT